MKRIIISLLLAIAVLQVSAQYKHGAEFRCWIDDSTHVNIFLPNNFFDYPYRFPVLYLLHGTGGSYESWAQDGNLINIIEEMIDEGKCEPMVVVMPDVSPAMNGSYEKRFGNIMKSVESWLKVSRLKSKRAIAGLSMGGFYAMHISHYYPNKFDYVGLFSPIYTTKKMEIFNKDSASLFGIDEHSPDVYKNVKSDLRRQFQHKPQLYIIAIGKHDFLYNQNVLYRKYLDEQGYQYEYKESGGGHVWKNWQLYIKNFLPRLFRNVSEKDLEPYDFNETTNDDTSEDEE